MEFLDVIKILSAVISAVVAVCGVIGGVFWLVKRSARKLDRAEARARTLKRERDDAVQHRTIAENERDQARAERQTAIEVLRNTKRIAVHNYEEWERLNAHLRTVVQQRRVAESTNGDLTRSLEVAKEQEAALSREIEEKNESISELEQALRIHQSRLTSVVECGGRIWQVPIVVKQPEFVPLEKRHTRIISVVNLKGGVGKTTITANLAGYLSKYLGKWVLLLDLDHQRSLTQLLLSTDQRKTAAIARRTLQDFLLSPRTGADLRSVAQPLTGLDRCSIVGNSDAEQGYGTRQNLDDLEMELLCRWLVDPTAEDVRFLMRTALHSPEVCESTKGFDYVLIDCPPRLTTACINALAASDFVLIPAQAEPVSARSVPHLLRRIRELREAQILPALKILGIVANRVSAKVEVPTSKEAKVLRGIEGLALKAWGHPVKLFDAKLRESEFYSSASRKMEDQDRLSFAVDAPHIREQYATLLKEMGAAMEGQTHESLGLAGVPA